MLVWALSGFQLSVYSSPTILMSPAVTAAPMISSMPSRRKSALASASLPLMIA